MTKKAIEGEEARNKLMQGINMVADAVKCTLGPSARYVMLERPYGSPLVINDGVTITKDIESTDPYKTMGIRLIQEVASNAQDSGGDGTTTATLLARELCREGLTLLDNGFNPLDMKIAFDVLTNVACDIIDDLVIDCDDEEEKQQQIFEVATIAANNDSQIGALIADALQQTNYEGIITVEESHSNSHSFDIVEGMELDVGYASPYFITEPGSFECSLDSAYVHLSSDIITQNDQLIPAMEAALKDQKALFVIAKGIEGEALQTLIVNVQKGVIRGCGVVAPAFHFDEVMQDLEALIGESNLVGKIVVGKNYTRIIGAKGDVTERCAILTEQITKADLEGERNLADAIYERKSKLTGGVGVIRVGASSATELKETKARVDDALNTTKAAIKEGVVIGGGMTFLKVSRLIDEYPMKGAGVAAQEVLVAALHAPVLQLGSNAGVDPQGLLDNLLGQVGDYGFNAKTRQFGNLREQGVLDAASVLKSSLRSAVSIASMVILTEVLVADL
tara:strand:+ start:2386 stop:3906 length:1521 start_codon:yes stop_codon:yes gene_type:complete